MPKHCCPDITTTIKHVNSCCGKQPAMPKHFRSPVLVLAAGDQVRWNTTHEKGIPEIKQLCKIGNETLIERMERQFPDCIVFTNNPNLSVECKRVYPVEDNYATISTLFSTRSHWREWTTILLGDVMYSREMVKRLDKQKDKMLFYGDESEIYAIKFHESLRDRLAKTIMSLVSHPGWSKKYGKLWNLYRYINGYDYRYHIIDKAFIRIADCRDFDEKSEYLNYIET